MADDGRPAGGTARRGGDKGARKVQWLDAPPRNDSSSSHALDEHGLDPNAFETLTTALEQHRKRAPPPPRIHFFPPPPAPHTFATHASHPLTTADAQREYRAPVSIDSTPPDTTPNSPQYQAPGHYIDENERHGLPGTEDLESYAEQRAQQVVRAHTLKRNRRFFGIPISRKNRDQNLSEKPDVERDATSAESAPRPFAGGGVLSTLLTLYDQAPILSGASTPARSPTPDPFEKGQVTETKPHNPKPTKKHKKRFSWDFGRLSRSTSPTPPEHSPGNENNGSNSSSGANSTDPLGRMHPSVIGSQASSFLGLKSRPVQARNGGGVIGSLIASTGNITGVATPAASTVVPNVKRPGYHLSRYSLETELPTRKNNNLQRSRSMGFTGSGSQTPSVTSTPPSPRSPAESLPMHGSGGKTKWTGVLKDIPYASSVMSGFRSARSSPAQTPTHERDSWLGDYTSDDEKRKEKKRRKKAEIFITRHVAQIIQRQEFIPKLTRAMMMFGAPSHRIPTQIQTTARVLDITLSCMYLPDVVLISFDDPSTGTSQIKFIRQGSVLDLSKLQDAYKLYWKVIHDDLSVSEASQALDELMRRKQIYTWWQLCMIGGLCSAAICTLSFNGSFLDAILCIPLGALLVAIQIVSGKHELYSNVFEITVATLFSFIAAAAASNRFFCYSAIASSSVVLILPGFIVLSGALEVSSRNIVSGSVRILYAVIYSLFLGFGLSIGAQAYEKITRIKIVGTDDVFCAESHPDTAPWYQQRPSKLWAFLTVPLFALGLSLRNFAPLFTKQTLLLVLIACAGWTTNYFTSTRFVNQSDMSSAAGAFAVGFISNVYARFFNGNAFVIMLSGMLLQLPSGLGNGGLLTFVNDQTEGSSTSYISGFQTALQLISVAIGLSVGLGVALVIVHPLPSRRRAGMVFSF